MLTEPASFRSGSRTGSTVLLWEGMVRGPLPLSLGMVGADISQLTMGALDAGKVGVGGEQGTRATERFENLVYGEISCFWEFSCLGWIWCCYVSWVGKTYSIPAKLRPSLQNTIQVFLCQQKHNVSPTYSFGCQTRYKY